MAEQIPTYEIVKNTIIVAIFLFAALVLATRFGFIYCGQIPYWCDAYRTIMSAFYQRNYPAVLILYGESGSGDPDKLFAYLRNSCHLYVRKADVRTVALGNLDMFDVVVLEHAQTLDADQLDTLWDYVAKGGKLLVAADAGTVGTDYLTYEMLGEENKTGVVNRWDRVKEDGQIVPFGSDLLGLRYVGWYADGKPARVRIVPTDDVLTRGIPSPLTVYLPFVVTEIKGGSVFGNQVILLSATDVSEYEGVKPPYPLALRIGYRIVYTAFPPESILDENVAGRAPQLAFFLRNLCDWMSS